jgi:VanZ family protein
VEAVTQPLSRRLTLWLPVIAWALLISWASTDMFSASHTSRYIVPALAIAAAYSALDEFHQSFVPSRTASPWDSLLDTTGAATAQFLLWLWFRFRSRNSIESPEDAAPAGRD